MMSNLDRSKILAGLILVFGWSAAAVAGGTEMQLKRVTTILFTDDVDACSAFYTERLGFEQTMAVPARQPGETGNQFAAATNGQYELMFQSFKSAEDDVPGVVGRAHPPSFMLYLEVPDLDAAIARMEGLEPAISRRKTFYGSDEIGYRDPSGTVVILAEFPAEKSEDADAK
jgi:catechol 2,3-dioxygenase-like lactoylglutathione lyase family enzyme